MNGIIISMESLLRQQIILNEKQAICKSGTQEKKKHTSLLSLLKREGKMATDGEITEQTLQNNLYMNLPVPCLHSTN